MPENMDLRDQIEKQFSSVFSNHEILGLLKECHEISISNQRLERILQRMNLYRRKKTKRMSLKLLIMGQMQNPTCFAARQLFCTAAYVSLKEMLIIQHTHFNELQLLYINYILCSTVVVHCNKKKYLKTIENKQLTIHLKVFLVLTWLKI